MKNRNARRYFGGVFTAVMFLALSVFFTGGCGGGSDDHAVIARAYYIGEGWEGLALYLKRYCIDFLPYDGESTDGLLFVSYGDDFVPSDGDIKSIKRAYEAGCFVVLVHATMDRANEFLGHIGLPPHFDIEGDGGEQKLVEILAVYRQQRDDGGTDIFTWVTPEYTAPVKSESASDDDPAKKPPLPEDDFDPDEFNEARTRHFVQYVVDEEKRLEDAERAREFAKAAVSSATDDLTRIAQAQIITRDASKYKQHFMINYYIYSCHSYNAADGVDYDWFVVQQRAMLNPQNNYAKKDAHDEYLAKVTGYMVHYDFENTLDDINGVQLVNTSPASTSGSTSVTSGFSWSLGGDVGVSGSSPSMNLSGSVTYSSSETVEIADCTVTNSSAPSEAKTKAEWRYEFSRPGIEKRGAPFYYGNFHDAARLSRSNFEPFNQWLWKIPPGARDRTKGFKSKFTWVNGYSFGNQVAAWIEIIGVEHHDWVSSTETYSIPFIYAPLIAGNGLDFGVEGGYQPLKFGTARPWMAESDQEWCELSQYKGEANETDGIYVTVAQNETGANRWANITLRTADGKGECTVKVFQSSSKKSGSR
ncbi:MAG: BACON domain-containing protein [Synergistota bacterium]|jgi:hypothetical protein|nr:BACON domain-containing protein [Synergistota bacterium]OPZ40007.1 MAG: Leukocidin/Hemolysin toxin family protein [Synergistetes bacterium ADurb.BinA166]